VSSNLTPSAISCADAHSPPFRVEVNIAHTPVITNYPVLCDKVSRLEDTLC
jgi:hypothetical protein